MKKHLFLKSLLIAIGLLVTSLTSPTWGKYIYLNTANLTGWEDASATFKLYPGTGSDVNGVKVYDHMYRFDVPKATGTMWFKRYNSDGKTLWNQFEVTYNASYNVYKVTSWSKAGCSDQCSDGSYDASVTIKEIYLDVHTNWYKDGPLFKLTTGGKTYTTTGYVGTNLVIFSVPSPSGTLQFERWKSDNSTSWNTASTTYNSSYNAYEITDWGAVSGSYNVKIVDKPNYFYLDNSQTAWAETYQYLLIGHDKPIANTQVYRLSASDIANTKLRYYSNTTLTFRDAGYISFISSGSSWSSGDWGTTTADDASKYTAPYTSTGDYTWDKVYLFVPASGSNNASLTRNEYSNSSGMNNTQTIKYSVSYDGGSNYDELTSGRTPAQITISAYKFVNGTYNSVSNTSNSQSVSADQSSTYSASVNAAYTGATSLSYTSKLDGYTFVDWYNSATGGSTVSNPYYPKANGSVYARFRANSYTVRYYSNSASYTGTASDTTAVSTHYYDVAKKLTANGFSLTGYTFAGWGTDAGTTAATYTDQQSVSNLSSTDGATVNLYARWSPVTYTISYTLDGGTNYAGAPTSYNIETATIVLGTPTKEHYHFDGWTDDNNSDAPITSIPVGSTGNVSITAHWTRLPMVYLKNTMNWANAYVSFYSGNYWDVSNNPSHGTGSLRSSEFYVADPAAMTYNSSTGLFEYECPDLYTYKYASFTKNQQLNYGEFSDNNEVIYLNNKMEYGKVVVVNGGTTTTRNTNVKYYESGLTLVALASGEGTGWFIPGGWTSWETKTAEFSWNTSPNVRWTKTLTHGSDIEFKIYNHGVYYGFTSGLIKGTETDRTFVSGQNNCALRVGAEGTYTFDFNTSTKKLSVTYPAVFAIAGGFNSWSESANTMSGTTTRTASITLTPGAQALKIISNGSYYGYDDAHFTGTATQTLGIDEGNITVDADVYPSGSYSLSFNTSTKALTITFPTAYTVTYNANSASSGTIPAESGRKFASGTNVTLATNSGSLARTGYSFNGWNTAADGTGTHYNTGATLSSIGGNVTLYAEWTAVELTFTGETSSDWSVVSNWSPACIPTIEHPVLIQSTRTCQIQNGTHAKALRVRIDKDDESRKDIRLQINEKASLIVAEDIKAKHQGDADFGATNDWDLWIMTWVSTYWGDANGNGGLVCGKRDTETFVSYMFASKIYRFGSYWVNQYVGIPFASMSPYDWYGVYIFEYNPVNDKWTTPEKGKDLKSFTAYNIINKNSTSYTSFFSEGYLNLPGINDDENPETSLKYRQQRLTCGARYGAAFDGDNHGTTNGDYMFANSWTAPISIQHLDDDDISDLDGDGDPDMLKEIHIFNAGFISDDDSIKHVGDKAGQWTTITFAGARYLNDSVIPSTQAFCVTAKVANATLTLDYKKHVYDPAVEAGRISTCPTRAPRRTRSEGDPNILQIKVMSDSILSDNVYLFEREDYTNGYDNGWDGHKYFGLTNVPQIYGIQGEGKLAINAIPELEGAEIGFKAGTDTNVYVLSFEYNNDEPLYLYDRETQMFTRISNDATYEFTTDDTAEHARFIITRSNAPWIETGIDALKDDANRAEKFFENNMLFIRRGDKVYHVDGSVVK